MFLSSLQESFHVIRLKHILNRISDVLEYTGLVEYNFNVVKHEINVPLS